MKPEVLDFLTGIHADRSDATKRKQAIIDRAFENAYRDMATHTVAYTKDAKEKYVYNDSKLCNENRKQIKKALQDCVCGVVKIDDLPKISSQDDFDKWHESICDYVVNSICKDCVVSSLKKDKDSKEPDKTIQSILKHTDEQIKTVFSYGQAQKLINMLLKYLYIYYQCDNRNELDEVSKWFHVPIDSYVIKKVFGSEKYNGKPWSKIDSYEEYKNWRDKIRKERPTEYPSDFMWELAEWPFGN